MLVFKTAIRSGLLLWSCVLSTSLVHAQTAASYATVELAQSDPDFSLQGEYEGAGIGLQAIARGNGEFELVLFPGGLPGAGWDQSPPTRVDGDRESLANVVSSKKLKRIERKSPTLGDKPPANAAVLFDGTQSSLDQNWASGARRTSDGLLMQGATTLGQFRDYTLHVEFRTPFEPAKLGQRRGNSGVYHQGRYETQILDSFGLEVKSNETGGVYGIREPELNMCLPPLSWQTYDIDFTAARYDSSGMKLANAMLSVRLNGVVVQQNVSLPRVTAAAPNSESQSDGPIHLQDHGNDVRYRNIWIVKRDPERESLRPIIPGFERFLTGNPNGGRVLLSQLGCVSCHDSNEPSIAPKSAPLLDTVGARVRFDHLVGFASHARLTKSGTTMPDLFHGNSEEKRLANAKAIASFLSQTGHPVDRSGDSISLKRGEELFHSIGCVACHAPRNSELKLHSTSVPLGDLTAKYTLDGLSHFLMNPHLTRSSGLMPTLIKNGTESRDIACYLLGDAILSPSSEQWSAKVYLGEWDKLPDFDKLSPTLTLTTTGLDLRAAQQTSNFAIQFQAYLPISIAGDYRFYLSSDDGSRLWIDGKVIIDHDGIHPSSFKNKRTRLETGVHRIQVDYFEKGGEEALKLEIEGPESGRMPIDGWITSEPSGQLDKELVPSRYQPDASLIANGEDLFRRTGCANCHSLKLNEKIIQSQLVTKPLASLDLSRGCLAEVVPAGAPDYNLTSIQKDAIVTAIHGLQSTLKSADQVHLQMASANCYACHTRETIGGPEATRNSFFKTTVQEMGNEGRLPPSLTGVGDKLRPEVIDAVLSKGSKDRPYVVTRMPGYGTNSLGGLREHLVSLDARSSGASTGPSIEGQAGNAHAVAGRKLVGDEGLACIKCHRFGDKATPGIGAIDLLSMPQRLREDWFHRYMLAPTEYRPGTRMPLSFPDGKSTITTILDADADKQIDAIWSYLSLGKEAKLPSGLNAKAIVLKAETQPILYRNFIEGLGPRGIAVGYPQKVNVAWDAGSMNLRLLWKNEFIDASKHWVGRGPGFQSPLGDDIVEFEPTVPIAALDSPSAPWPTTPPRSLGYRFRGYTLNQDGQPTFKYALGDVEVADFPKPMAPSSKLMGIERQLKISNGKGTPNLYFRAAVGRIEKQAEDAYLLDGKISIAIQGSEVKLVNIDDHQELRCRLPKDGEATLLQTLSWQ